MGDMDKAEITMVTSQEEIDTNSPVVPNSIFQRLQSNMTTVRVIFCHVLLFGIALSSPVDTKKKENPLIPEVTTRSPLRVNGAKNISNEQVQSVSNAQVEKSSTKKRDVPRVFTDKNEYIDDDFYEGRATEDYDGNQPLRTFADNGRIENSLFDSGKYRGMIFHIGRRPLMKDPKTDVESEDEKTVNDYRYYNEESRRKRTAALDGIFNKADSNREPEIHLSPEDLLVLAAYKQQHRLYNNFPYGRWSEINNAIDLPEEETETEEMYDRPENFFDKYYDQRYQNWANLPRNNKFMNHQGKGFSGYPQLRVPLYKRAIL